MVGPLKTLFRGFSYDPVNNNFQVCTRQVILFSVRLYFDPLSYDGKNVQSLHLHRLMFVRSVEFVCIYRWGADPGVLVGSGSELNIKI